MIGARLLAWRKGLGLTKVEAAALLRVGYSTYCAWEYDKRHPANLGPVLARADQISKEFGENAHNRNP